MSESPLLWWIPLLPLLGALLAAIVGSTKLRALSWVPVVLAFVGSCAISLSLLAGMSGEQPLIRTAPVTWFAAGDMTVSLTLSMDTLTAVMLSAITFVGSWIAIFSIGYMHGENGFGRYFALVSLFVAAMTGLVLAENFLVLFACWEGVGLCSYLLVGYFHAKPSAADAARKAFLVTRLGDVGLILGIFLLWSQTGYALDFPTLFERVDQVEPGMLMASCLLIFCGAVGKSAQFPLYVWLPDAMEGPTPVSALIHAATMVTAGVYLVARCMPLFELVPEAQLTVAIIGAVTALIAGFIALTQFDLKRVLAYSTVSQLGFMFLALGAGTGELRTLAVTAAIFHLFTHAFFKAVLFLSAGSVMHAMHDVIDMRQFSGLRKKMPITHAAFLCGAAALAGIPLLSGFWSKEEIFSAVDGASHAGSPYATVYGILLIVGLLTAGLTAFYTFRAYFRTFWGPEKTPPGVHEPHEAGWGMGVPLLVLALGALVIGALVGPGTDWIGDFLGKSTSLAGAEAGDHHAPAWIVVASVVLALGGIALAWWLYATPSEKAETTAARFGMLNALSANQLYLDDIYRIAFVRPFEVLALLASGIDALVDAISRLISSIPGFLGRLVQPIQIGLVQFYALAMVMGLAVFLGFLVFRGGQ